MERWQALLVITTFGQLVVLAAAAIFAYLQLRGLRRQQEAQLVQHIFDELNDAHFAAALHFVYNDLPERLKDSAYVRAIRDGRATASTHSELVVMHFFNELGLLIHKKLVSEDPIVPFIASPCIRSWQQLAPVIELMRREYPHAYTPFESLVARSRAVDFAAINPRFRAETPRLRSEWNRTGRELSEQRLKLPEEIR